MDTNSIMMAIIIVLLAGIGWLLCRRNDPYSEAATTMVDAVRQATESYVATVQLVELAEAMSNRPELIIGVEQYAREVQAAATLLRIDSLNKCLSAVEQELVELNKRYSNYLSSSILNDIAKLEEQRNKLQQLLDEAVADSSELSRA